MGDVSKVGGSLLLALIGAMALTAAVSAAELDLLHCWGGVRQPWVEEMTDAFEEAYGVRVNAQVVSCSALLDAFVTSVAGGVAPDVVMVHSLDIPNLARSGVLLSLETYMEQNSIERDVWYPSEIESGTWNGDVYAFPIRTGGDANSLLFYNRTLFKEAGLEPTPPKTFDELDQMSRILIRYEDDQLAQTALPFWGGDQGGLGWFYSAGGELLSADGKEVLMDSSESINAMSWIRDHFASRYRGGFNDVSRLNTQARLRSWFAESRSAMLRGGSWEYSLILEANPDIDLAVGLPPVRRPGDPPGVHVGTYAYAITGSSNQQDLAWELLQWLTLREETAGYFMFRQGRPSPVRAFNQNPEYFDQNPYWMVIGEALATVATLPQQPYVGQLIDLFNEARVLVTGDTQSPQVALSEAAQRARAVVESY